MQRYYRLIQELEDTLSEQLAPRFGAKAARDATVFIPSLIMEFDRHWKARLEADS